MKRFDVLRPVAWGYIDHLFVDPSGLLRLTGWAKGEVSKETAPRVMVGGEPASLLNVSRFARADARRDRAGGLPHAGVIIEYLVPRSQYGRSGVVVALDSGAQRYPVPFALTPPPYAELLTTDHVYGRDNIYGYGPPIPHVSPEVLEICAGLKGRVLDFGCGCGALVAALRRRGVDASGLEIDRPAIRETLMPEVASSVHLYDGSLPSPHADGTFDAVVSFEVLEHIPRFEEALAEMARLTRKTLIISVPDIGVLPLGARFGLAPWHLLESTHINFFTQTSLTKLLSRHFRRIEFGRIGPCQFNDTPFHTSIVAHCEKV